MPEGTLRFAQAEDAAQIAAIYAPHVADSAVSFELTPPSPGEVLERIRAVQAYAPWLVCELSGRVAGYAYVSRHGERAAYRWSLDSALYVSAEHQRRGIGRALYTTLFGLARSQGYYAAHAAIALPNAASVAVHEALGFRPLGVFPGVGYKQGAWRDIGWWQLELRERRGAPAPPITPEQARAQRPAEWQASFDAGQQLLASSRGARRALAHPRH